MNLTDIQAAGLRMMLAELEADPEHTLSTEELRRWIGRDATERAIADEAELRSCNRDMEEQSYLSSDAQQYVAKLNSLMAEMKRAQAVGSRKWEARLNLNSEGLVEFYSEMVLGEERNHFIEYRPDGSNWDDRWHFAGEFYPPLPSLEAIGKLKPFPNPKGQAQKAVIRELLRDVGDDI